MGQIRQRRIGWKELASRKKNHKDGGIFYALFLAPKIKYSLIINNCGVVDENKCLKDFTDVSNNLDRKEYFKMFNGDDLIAKIPLSWKKSFSQGALIPHKMKNCSDCKKDILCDECDKLVYQRKELLANLNKLKRDALNEFGYMLPKYIIT